MATSVMENLGALENGEVFVAAWEENLFQFDEIEGETLQGLLQVNAITNTIFSEDPAFAPLREALGTTPAERDLVLRAVTTHNFPPESDYTVEQYGKILLASHVREQLSRAYISRLLENGSTFGLESWEQDVLQTSCQVGGIFDQMCAKWRDDVQHNAANDKAVELGLLNPYAVIKGSDEAGYSEVSYAEAYSEDVKKIAEYWTALAESLDSVHAGETQQAMAAFFRKYSEAITCTDLTSVTEVWRDVDRAWMKVHGRVQPIPSREFDYYDKNKIRVFPDYRLSIVVDESLTQQCNETQAAQLKYLTELFGDASVFKATVIGMKKVLLLPNAFDFIFSGSLDFQPAGQSLPNDQSVRDEAGAKVFLNQHAMEDRWVVAIEAAGKTFTHDAELFAGVDVGHDGLAIMTAGHEYGEPLFNSDAVTLALGAEVVSMLNEDLATQTITSIMPMWEKDVGVSRKDMENHAMYLLGNYLRYIALARGVEHLRPYYEGMGLMGLRRMIESGFIYQDSAKEWHVEMGKLESFYEASLKDLKTQVEIAQNGDQMGAVRYLISAEYMEKLPMIADLIRKITLK